MTEAHAAIYARISNDKEGAGLGVERQETDCRALADRLGWQVVAVHTDNDISAYSGKPRPGYQAVLEAMRGGTITGVLAWHPDRLHRSPRELEDFIDACEQHAVTTQTVRAGSYDLATPSGRMQARIAGAVARQESEHKADRIRAQRRQSALAGEPQDRGRSFAYADPWTLQPDEAAELRAACEALLGGATLHGIARDWNERGVTTAKGKRWNETYVRATIDRPKVAGLVRIDGEIAGEGKWPAAVDPDTWRAVHGVLADPSRRTTPGPHVRHLLSHVACCGVCGGPVVVSGSPGARLSRYQCKQGDHVVRNKDRVDDYVTGLVLARLERADAADLLTPPAPEATDPAALRAEAARLRGRLDEIAGAYAAGEVTRSQLATATERLRGELDRVEAGIAEAASSSPLATLAAAEDVSTVWGSLDVDRRRAVVDALLTVTIDSVGRTGRQPEDAPPPGVRIEWKGVQS